MENIKLKIRSLQYFPYRGAIYSNKYNRILIYKKYLIFYEIHEEEKLIIIKRIIHSNINKNINYWYLFIVQEKLKPKYLDICNINVIIKMLKNKNINDIIET
jgi:hypothetical protein